MVEYLADILREQVARQAFLYALSGSGERFGGMKQGFVMAGVENYGCSRVVQIVRAYALAQRTEQSVQMSFELGRQPFDGTGYLGELPAWMRVLAHPAGRICSGR